MKNIIAAVLLAWACPAEAGSAGAEPFNFLFLDSGARPAAMGGAYTALAADSNALHYNPAGLALVNRNEATYLHNQYFAGITQNVISAAFRQRVGLSFNYLNSGNVARTTLSNPDGTGLDYAGLKDLAVSAGYGHPLGDSWALGASGKYIRETIAGISASGFVMDVGALWTVPWVEGLSLGSAFQNVNISRTVKFQGKREELPINFRWGAGYRFDAFGHQNALAFDFSKERNESVLIYAGAETIIAKLLAVRLGFNNRNTVGTGITGGVGANYKNASLDFAIVSYGTLGFTHRVSGTYRWGEGGPREVSDREPRSETKASDTPEEHFAAAEQAIATKDFTMARENLKKAARLLGENDTRRALYFSRMGYIYWLEKNYPQARAAFLSSISEADRMGQGGSSTAETFAKLGLCWSAENNDVEAAAAFEKGLQSNPDDATRRFLSDQLRRLRR